MENDIVATLEESIAKDGRTTVRFSDEVPKILVLYPREAAEREDTSTRA